MARACLVAPAFMGCAALASCETLAAISGPASKPVSVTDCFDLVGRAADAPSDNRGVRSIEAIWPAEVVMGDVFLLTAGVSSNTRLDARALEADRAASARDLSKCNLDSVFARSASRPEDDAARQLYLQAVSDDQAALEAVAPPGAHQVRHRRTTFLPLYPAHAMFHPTRCRPQQTHPMRRPQNKIQIACISSLSNVAMVRNQSSIDKMTL